MRSALTCMLLTSCVGSWPLVPDSGTAGSGGGNAFPSGGGVATAGDGGLPLVQACTRLNGRRCDVLKACGLIEDSAEAYRECIAFYTATWCGPSRWPPRVEVGTLRYDPLTAALCLADWSTRSCADWATEPSSCQRFLSPAVVLGGRCYDGYAECVGSVCRGGACPKTCVSRGTVGDSCGTNSDCANGLYCRPPTGSSASGQCVALGLEQSTCGPTMQCGPGLLCNASICRKLPGPEQGCLGGRCDDTAFCVVDRDGGVCEARRTAGERCTDDSQCASTLLCDVVSEQCVPTVLGSAGAPCTSRQRCPPGTACAIETGAQSGVCARLRSLNESCRVATDCQDHLTCLSIDGGFACAPRQRNGATCTTSRDCLAFSTCITGSCAALPFVTELCSSARPCLWGACVETADGGSVCIEPQGPGQPCRLGSNCASGRCEQGLCAAACLP
jgi:hypothetical protein